MERIMRKWLLAAWALTMLAACNVEDIPAGSGEQPSAKEFTERMVPVVNTKQEAKGTVTLRFYNDMPNVAYINVSTFQTLIYPGTSTTVTEIGDGVYQLANGQGTATVDVNKDVFESDDYEAFVNVMGAVQQGMPSTLYDAMPFIRWKTLEASPKSVHTTLDYGKFGIDLRADASGVYFPLATIADLYVDIYMHVVDYNGQNVMVVPEGAAALEEGYPKWLITPLLTDTRTADMAKYAYNNLCFTLSELYGYPGRTLLEKAGLGDKGLDLALQEYGKAGQMTRELLKSENMYEFVSGSKCLGMLLEDGGHTYTDMTKISNCSGSQEWMTILDDVSLLKEQEFVGYCPEAKDIVAAMQERMAFGQKLVKAQEQKMGKKVKYYKKGATAYCLFDMFECQEADWKKYYKGEAARPTVETHPEDWMAILMDGLTRAENDPDVKNFVLDLATNGGGSSDLVVFITSLFSNKADLPYENVLTGQKMKATFEVDRNLDKKFDENDQEVKYHLNFAVTVSGISFSCGNLLPALLKDYGIPLIGQRTGGGACCVFYNPSADGFGYRYSSHRARMTDTKFVNIDPGIEPDYKLEQPEDFYDLEKLEGIINAHYAK